MRIPDHTKLRHIMQNHYDKGWTAADSYRDIVATYGEGIASERTAERWFAKFKSGDMEVEDKPGRGRKSEVDDDELLAALEEDESQTTRMLADSFGVHHSTIADHLHKLGKMARKGFTDEQRAMLRKAFEENESLAEKGRKTRLAAETGLNESQVKNWFHDHKKTKKGKTTTGNNTTAWDANTSNGGAAATTTPNTNSRTKAPPTEAAETPAGAQAVNMNAYFRW